MLTTGQAIRAARKKAGLSQAKLGDAAGLARNMMTLYENDKVVPSVYVAITLADLLGITVDELLGHERKPRKLW